MSTRPYSYIRPYQDRVRARNRAYVDNLKRKPCVDCGRRYDPVAMDFDHVRGEKTAHVANMARQTWSIRRLAEEIDKCELVCANCHAERTDARRPVASYAPTHIGHALNEYKNRPCQRCGEQFSTGAMHFDHRRAKDKLIDVSRLKRYSWKNNKAALVAEIAKCDILCACCHRLKTAKQLNWGMRNGTDPLRTP